MFQAASTFCRPLILFLCSLGCHFRLDSIFGHCFPVWKHTPHPVSALIVKGSEICTLKLPNSGQQSWLTHLFKMLLVLYGLQNLIYC